jgi:hypothetical protein
MFCVIQSSPRTIFSMEGFLSLKNPVQLDGQGINTGLLQTICITKLASSIEQIFFSNQMNEHRS